MAPGVEQGTDPRSQTSLTSTVSSLTLRADREVRNVGSTMRAVRFVGVGHSAVGFRGEFTLGHENAGWVAQLGAGATGFKEGDAVAVYGSWGW